MKKSLVILILLCSYGSLWAQSSCSELMDMVKSQGYGNTFSSYSSDAISKVTFYEIQDNSYNTYYFAAVQFTSSYKEYLYQVGSETKSNYSYSYLTSAGKAFWKYIHPYNEVLGCAPDF